MSEIIKKIGENKTIAEKSERESDSQHIVIHSNRSAERLRSLKYGDTFAVFDHYGDIRPSLISEEGLYFDGTRFLSCLVVDLDGLRPLVLGSTVRDDNDQLVVTLTNPDLFIKGKLHLPANSIHISRRTFLLNTACYVEIGLENYSFDPVNTTLTINFAGDYKDIYEIRGMSRVARGEDLVPEIKDGNVFLSYVGIDNELRTTQISFSPLPEELTDSSAQFSISLLPRESLVVRVTIACTRSLRVQPAPLDHENARMQNLEEILNDKSNACLIYSSNGQFNAWVRRSLADLHMMITPLATGPYPYAGVPWFNTPFGRDGIITAWECLWIRPDIAKGVLSYLAMTQAVELNPEQDAEPGKILHETRSGEMATLKEMPFGLYYGSVDATPLFVALAGAYYERTGDQAFLESIWSNICAALQWMVIYGDKDGDGFLEYERSSLEGLIHQGWKDGDDAIFHSDGTPAQGSIALCEVQGYAYAAYKAASMLAELLGSHKEAICFKDQAETLHIRFNEAFWCEELSTYAIALDGMKQRCSVKTSNAGQCLFTEIATPERAERVARTLLSSGSYSGWGIRTIASSQPRFNPMSYHNGSIWPHDNALIAFGMTKYGLTQQANIIFNGLFEAAMYFDLHRMPELFCGFSKEPGEGPILYPVACAPQAWSAASMFLLFQASLGMSVDGIKKRITLMRPTLPDFLNEIHITNLQVGDSTLGLDVVRQGNDVGITVKNATNDLAVLLMR